jgi:hypothetical protein
MGTSRSSSTRAWTAGAFVFSGRPNPFWQLDSAHVAQLMAIWAELKPAAEALAAEDAGAHLGYTGCYISNDAGDRWTARDALVIHQRAETVEERDDPLRRFERAVLQSAPSGSLPPDLLEPLR